MKNILLFPLLLSIIIVNAQTTAIPDANFEQTLITLGYDVGPVDGTIPTSNINSITYLNVQNKNIYNLTGIEGFTALQMLVCSDNYLSYLDLTHNNSLTALAAQFCGLSCLNIKNGNNTNITDLLVNFNSNLTCIEVDNVNYSNANWTGTSYTFDSGVSFSTGCPFQCLVGVEENNLSNLSLYPNPTTEDLSIDIGEVQQNLRLTLTNNLGQVVLSQNYYSTSFIYLDIDYPKGLYFLSIETQDEVVSRKIIVK